MEFNKLIFDSTPGLAYSSINAVAGSDVVALVMRMEILDILGTKEMMKGVYELLQKPSFVVVNMVLQPQQQVLASTLENLFGKQTLAYIPCLCDVRSHIAKGKAVIIDEKSEFSVAITKLSKDVEHFYKKQG